MRIVVAAVVLGLPLAGCGGAMPMQMTSGPVPIQMDEARDTALNECNVKAAVWKYRSRQTFQFASYRTCMAGHTQQE